MRTRVSSKLFLIGNGESRKGFDLTKLKNHGKIYGCNGLYRDFTPDGLVSVDPGIMHDIYNSGYAFENTVYFRDWSSIPSMLYDDIVNTYKQDMKNQYGEEPKIIESEKRDGDEFVIHGSAATWGDKVLKEKREYKGIGSNILFITWLRKEDKVRAIGDYMNLNNGTTGDMGWSAGPTILNIACNVEKPTEVYMIGCDLYSNTNKFNNMYKNTLHYEKDDINAVDPVNWVQHYKANFTVYSDTDFYKVNEKPLGTDKVNSELDEWFECINLKYTTISLINRNILDLALDKRVET